MSNMRIIVLLLCACTSMVCRGQSQYITLYETDNPCGKYIWSRKYQEAAGNNVYEIVIANDISINATGAVCKVTMHNVHMFIEKTVDMPPNKIATHVAQQQVTSDSLDLEISKSTKIIFQDKVTEISKIQILKPPLPSANKK